jgi:hypothetical protein
MKSRWITHKNVRIFIADFSDYGSNAMGIKEEADYIVQMLTSEPEGSVLSVANVDGTVPSESIMKAFNQLVPVTNRHVKARCVVGVRGFRKQLVAAFTRLSGRAQFKIFDSMDEALDYMAGLV